MAMGKEPFSKDVLFPVCIPSILHGAMMVGELVHVFSGLLKEFPFLAL
jgi:hypothetical protein